MVSWKKAALASLMVVLLLASVGVHAFSASVGERTQLGPNEIPNGGMSGIMKLGYQMHGETAAAFEIQSRGLPMVDSVHVAMHQNGGQGMKAMHEEMHGTDGLSLAHCGKIHAGTDPSESGGHAAMHAGMHSSEVN